MRSDWASDAAISHVLAALMPQNALVLKICRATGLRISDVLALKVKQLESGKRFTIKETKTGKARRVSIPAALRLEALEGAGRLWVFEGRTDWRKHRTRQAVNKDLARAAKLFRASGVVARGQNVTPHTMRKAWAVDEFDRTGSIAAVQSKLNHTDPEITMVYALSRELTEQRQRKRGKGKR